MFLPLILMYPFFSSYQNGPDTYLLQLRDVDFPVRLREYMKVAGSRGPGGGHIISDENGFDWDVSVQCFNSQNASFTYTYYFSQ